MFGPIEKSIARLKIVRMRWYTMSSSVQQPEATLALLMRGLGTSFDPLQLQWAAPVRHNVGGNGMRRGTSSELKLDERWRDDFGLRERVAIDIGNFPGRYPFLKLGLLRIMGGRHERGACINSYRRSSASARRSANAACQYS